MQESSNRRIKGVIEKTFGATHRSSSTHLSSSRMRIDPVQPHEIRGTGRHLSSRNHSQYVPGSKSTGAHQFLFGRGEHLFRTQCVLPFDRLYSPEEIHAVAHRRTATEGINSGFGPILGHHSRRVA